MKLNGMMIPFGTQSILKASSKVPKNIIVKQYEQIYTIGCKNLKYVIGIFLAVILHFQNRL